MIFSYQAGNFLVFLVGFYKNLCIARSRVRACISLLFIIISLPFWKLFEILSCDVSISIALICWILASLFYIGEIIEFRFKIVPIFWNLFFFLVSIKYTKDKSVHIPIHMYTSIYILHACINVSAGDLNSCLCSKHCIYPLSHLPVLQFLVI